MLNVVSAPQLGCQKEDKDKFWWEMNEEIQCKSSVESSDWSRLLTDMGLRETEVMRKKNAEEMIMVGFAKKR